MKTVVITGVSRGMGKAIAKKFLSEGWEVIGTSTSGKALLQHEYFQVYLVNMLHPQSIKAFAENLKKSQVRIDALINNAGVYLDEDTDAVSIVALRKTLEINLIGLIDLTERILPLMNEGGSIVNMSSGMGSLTNLDSPNYPAYRISKVAINVYTRILAARLRGKITVSSMDPGWVRTDMGGSGAPRDPREPAEEMFHLATSQVESGYFWYQGKKRSW
jgi:NAD(P)-dependent dehydrogenase (short-subunit alcohol dehydrogenase family)